MQLLLEFQDLHLQHKHDFGVVDTPFHITLQPDAELKRQRIEKIPIHYRAKIQTILDDLETNGIIERVGIDAARNVELGPEFINPFTFLPKYDKYKNVLVARKLNSITDFSKYHFPLKAVQVLIPRIIGIIFSKTEVTPANQQVALLPETQKLMNL